MPTWANLSRTECGYCGHIQPISSQSSFTFYQVDFSSPITIINGADKLDPKPSVAKNMFRKNILKKGSKIRVSYSIKTMITVSVIVSVVVIKKSLPEKPEKERVDFILCFQVTVQELKQGRTRKLWRSAVYWNFPHGLLVCFLSSF